MHWRSRLGVIRGGDGWHGRYASGTTEEAFESVTT